MPNAAHTVIPKRCSLYKQSRSERWYARIKIDDGTWYMRTLRFKQANPIVGTLAICTSKLQHYASCVAAKDAHAKL